MTKEQLLDKLPHGSGINGDWNIEDKGRYFGCYNFYDCMNEVGMYDGVADFQLIIPKKDPMSFRLHFLGKFAAYQNWKYALREYLDDTFAYCLEI